MSATDFTLVNLQYGDHSEEIETVSQSLSRKVFDFDEVDCFEDMDGLAALLECCDLIVSVANTTVHLAGALGRPTIGLLPYFPGWRWLSAGSHCLWYGSVRLLRQDVLGDWNNVLQRIATAIDTSREHFTASSIIRELDRS
jgi:ADP-heptose:LPS heptosyltransferase